MADIAVAKPHRPSLVVGPPRDWWEPRSLDARPVGCRGMAKGQQRAQHICSISALVVKGRLPRKLIFMVIPLTFLLAAMRFRLVRVFSCQQFHQPFLHSKATTRRLWFERTLDFTPEEFRKEARTVDGPIRAASIAQCLVKFNTTLKTNET
ncbi:hypothetical protein C8R44DRAFT_753732 [Mycena epipterygia]|nr:hypothetical protein C8R44DRAFT_753732 [Mycena epipterygia]